MLDVYLYIIFIYAIFMHLYVIILHWFRFFFWQNVVL